MDLDRPNLQKKSPAYYYYYYYFILVRYIIIIIIIKLLISHAIVKTLWGRTLHMVYKIRRISQMCSMRCTLLEEGKQKSNQLMQVHLERPFVKIVCMYA